MASIEEMGDIPDEESEAPGKSWEVLLTELPERICRPDEKSLIAVTVSDLLTSTPDQEAIIRKLLASARLQDIIFLLNHCQRIASAYEYVATIDNRKVAGNALLHTQREAALGFYYWLRKGAFSKQGQRGTIVKPTATGKTYTGAILAEMMPRKVVFLALSNDEVGKTQTDFTNHFGVSAQVQTLSAGEVCPKDARILITKFTQAMSTAIPGEFWTQVDLVIVDEADVNGLSDDRRAFIRKLSADYGFPIVAMSATEQQASGSRLEHVYPDSIVRIPMPEGLPLALEMGIIAPTQFEDLYCPASVGVDVGEVLTHGDLRTRTVNELMKKPEWFSTVFDHYVKNFKRASGYAPGVILMRDNQAISTCITEAEKHGIRVAAYTGDTDAAGLEALRGQLKRGEIDLLIGSRLPGRGMNIEEIEVVYNCLLTYSPQLFWQGGGRALRRHGNKRATVVAVMPAKMYNERTGRALIPAEWPLRHATFFDPHYFESGVDTPKQYFELGAVLPIRSIAEVVQVIKRHFDVNVRYNRASILAALINESTSLDLQAKSTVNRLTQLHNEAAERLTAILQEINEVERKGEKRINPTVERLLRQFAPDEAAGEILTRANERSWLQDYHLHKDSPTPALRSQAQEVKAKLFRCLSPLVTAVAQHFATEKVSVDDLFQEGYIAFTQALAKYDVTKRGTFGNYLLYYLCTIMARYVPQAETPLDVPLNTHETLRKVASSQESGKDFDGVADQVGIGKETLLDLLNATYNVQNGAEEGGDEVIPSSAWESMATMPDDLEELMYHRKFWPYLYEQLFGEKDTHTTLSPIEKRVIIFHICEGMSLKAIGGLYGLGREKMRAFQEQGLRRLRGRLGLRSEDGNTDVPTTIERSEVLLEMTGLKNKVIALEDKYFEQYDINENMQFHIYWMKDTDVKRPYVRLKLKGERSDNRNDVFLEDLGIDSIRDCESDDGNILYFVRSSANVLQ